MRHRDFIQIMWIEMGILDLPKGVKSVSIKEQKVFDGLSFPLILSPTDDFKDMDAQFWIDWVKKNLKVIEKRLLKYGAILFRGFPVDNAKDFNGFTKAFCYKEFPYWDGVPSRRHVLGNVYTTASDIIPFHQEMAYTKDYPYILFFYCDLPAKEGGETPIALSNIIYRKMAEREPEFVDRLEKEGLRYVRIAPDGDDVSSALGRGWQSTFLTSDKEEAERKANASGYDFEWLPDGSMKTITEVLPAIRVDKRTGKKMWFNMLFAFYSDWQDESAKSRREANFPNEDTISVKTIESMMEVMDEVSVSLRWQHTDVMLIDNRTVQHSRSDFFVPPRRIMASLFKDLQGPL